MLSVCYCCEALLHLTHLLTLLLFPFSCHNMCNLAKRNNAGDCYLRSTRHRIQFCSVWMCSTACKYADKLHHFYLADLFTKTTRYHLHHILFMGCYVNSNSVCCMYILCVCVVPHAGSNVPFTFPFSRNTTACVILSRRVGTKNLKPGSQHSALQREFVVSNSPSLVPKTRG